MTQLPKIEGQNRNKPLSYDPQTRRFITYDEIVSRKVRIVPLDGLSQQELADLVVERQRAGPDYKVADLNGTVLNCDQVVQEILAGTPFGNMVVEAEVAYLRELLAQIQTALTSRG